MLFLEMWRVQNGDEKKNDDGILNCGSFHFVGIIPIIINWLSITKASLIEQ